MSKLIVFTDLHILPEGGRIIGLDPSERLRKGIAHVNLHHPDTHHVLFTGDLTHRGDVASYQRLRDLLSELRCPYSLLLGNHDQRENFLSVFPEAPLDANGFVQQALDIAPHTGQGVHPDGARLLLLDTLFAPPYNFPDSYSGFLCEQRMDWLAQQLASAGKRPVHIFMHHPPHATGFVGMDAIALKNGEAFYELLLHHGNVRHIFAGHVHRTISGTSHGIAFSVFKSPCHQQPMPFAAEDTTLSVDEPGAYGIVLLRPDGVLVHTEDYEIASPGTSGYRVVSG
jgi:3',5'-cyclic AMP phosphodiesterase CpdA